MRGGLWSELRTLFWLQGKLTLAMFRSRRGRDVAWILRLLLTLVQALFTFPVALALGAGLAVGLALLSPRAAYEMAMLVNTFLFLIWLLMPNSYSSQVLERFEMSRLFAYPISFRGIVVGSTLVSLLSLTGLWTLPLLLGQVVGLAWHAPLTLPLVALGALPAFAVLVLAGRIMDDLFDLVADDRRLRTLALFVLTLPFLALWIGQYYVQFTTAGFEELPAFLQGSPIITQLEAAQSFSEVVEIVRPSRWLLWLPPGWVTAGMARVTTGDWLAGLGFLALSLAAVGGMLQLHAGITRRLMAGAALSLGAERVRSRRWFSRLPGPPSFWALFEKDWRYLWRSPIPKRMLFAGVMVSAGMLYSMLQIDMAEVDGAMRQTLPLIIGSFLLIFNGMAANLALAANYFGAVDREGFATLAQSAVDRRYVLLSANLTVLVLSLVIQALPLLILGALWRNPLATLLLLYLAFCLQVSGLPVYNAASILGPYRMEMKFSSQNRGGNMWGMLAWVVATPPVMALVWIPYLIWEPALFLALPLCLVYCLGLYALTLGPLARWLQRREHRILEAITSD